jgi:hypothetical protein
MPTEPPDDAMIDELLPLAGVSAEDSAARCWLESALAAGRGLFEPEVVATGFRRIPPPSPAKHNAPLDKIERASDQLIAAIEQLRRHPHAHASFWRFAAFGRVYVDKFERADVISTLTNVRDAAHNARVCRTGRPRNFRKQQIVDLALAFCARFSPSRPSGDANSFFRRFAKRLYEYSTGLSVDDKGQGIDRQIRVALRRLPFETERAKLLKNSSLRRATFAS